MIRQLEGKMCSDLDLESFADVQDALFDRTLGFRTREIAYVDGSMIRNALDKFKTTLRVWETLSTTMCFKAWCCREGVIRLPAKCYTIGKGTLKISPIHRFCVREYEYSSKPIVSYFRARNVFVWEEVRCAYYSHISQLFGKTFLDNQWGLRYFKVSTSSRWRSDKDDCMNGFIKDMTNREYRPTDGKMWYRREYGCLSVRKKLSQWGAVGSSYALNEHPIVYKTTSGLNVSILQQLCFSDTTVSSVFFIACREGYDDGVLYLKNYNLCRQSIPQQLHGDIRFMQQSSFRTVEEAKICESFIKTCIGQLDGSYGSWCMNERMSPSYLELPNIGQIKKRIANTIEILAACSDSCSYFGARDFVEEQALRRLDNRSSVLNYTKLQEDINSENLNKLGGLLTGDRLNYLYASYSKEVESLINPSLYSDGVLSCDDCSSCQPNDEAKLRKLDLKKKDPGFFKSLSSCLFLDLTEKSFIVKLWLIFYKIGPSICGDTPREILWIIVNIMLDFHLNDESFLDMSQYQNSTLKISLTLVDQIARVRHPAQQITSGCYASFLWMKYGVILFRHPVYKWVFDFKYVANNILLMEVNSSALEYYRTLWCSHHDFFGDYGHISTRSIVAHRRNEPLSPQSPYYISRIADRYKTQGGGNPLLVSDNIILFLPDDTLVGKGLVKGRLSYNRNVFKCMRNAGMVGIMTHGLHGIFKEMGMNDEQLRFSVLDEFIKMGQGRIKRDYFGLRQFADSPGTTGEYPYHTCVETTNPITRRSYGTIKAALIDNPRVYDLARDVLLTVDENGFVSPCKKLVSEPEHIWRDDIDRVAVRLFTRTGT